MNQIVYNLELILEILKNGAHILEPENVLEGYIKEMKDKEYFNSFAEKLMIKQEKYIIRQRKKSTEVIMDVLQKTPDLNSDAILNHQLSELIYYNLLDFNNFRRFESPGLRDYNYSTMNFIKNLVETSNHQKPVFDACNKIFQTITILNENKQKYFICPKLFCYERKDYDLLQLFNPLLKIETYNRNKQYNEFKSKTQKQEIKNRTIKNVVKTNLTLSYDKSDFMVVIKYMAFRKHNDLEDKLDLMFELVEGKKKGRLIHLDSYHQLEIEQIKENNPEFYESIKDTEIMRSSGFETKEMGKEKELYLERVLDGKSRQERLKNIRKVVRNYDDIIKNPKIIGGYLFHDIIKFARSNIRELKSIYKTLNH